jgi:signal transduction histidine kinase
MVALGYTNTMQLAARALPSIRHRMLQLVFACVLPMAVLAAVIVVDDYHFARQQLFSSARDTVRAVALALDAELSQPRLVLSTIAQSRLMREGSLEELHAHMREVEPPVEVGGLFLLGGDGQLLLHTRAELGETLPAPARELLAAAAAAAPSVTPLLTDPVTRRIGVAIVVPLPPSSRGTALGAWLPADRLGELMARQKLPNAWTVAVIDKFEKVVGRNKDMAKYLGVRATTPLLVQMAKADEAMFESVTLSGQEVVTVFSKSPDVGWTVVAGLPRDVFVAELRARALRIGLAAVVLLAATLALANWLSGRIVRSIQALRAPTAALGRGEPVVLPAPAFREAQDLGQSLLEASERQHQATADLRRSHDALVRSNLDLQQYAFVASHDMRGPLNTVSSYLDLLHRRHGPQLPADALPLLARAGAAVNHLDELTQALLSYARLDRQAQPFAGVPLEAVLQATLQALAGPLEQAGAQVTHDALPTVWGDRSMLAQLMQNLIGNAVKYRSTAPLRIHVSAVRQPPGWCISVRDNGIGIEPRHQERIFEIFKRLHTQQEIPGTGIGLAICRRVVHAHGGTLWVESTPGQGSTFLFTIADKETPP